MSAAFGLAFLVISQPAIPEFDAIKAQTLNARRAIRTADVTILRKVSDSTGLNSQTWRIWMDGAKIRGDYTPNSPEPTERIVHCLGCDRDGWGLYYTEKKNRVAEFRPASKFGEMELFAAVSPKHFGYTSSGLSSSWRTGFEGVFGAPQEGSKRVVEVDYLDVKCWQLNWITGPKSGPILWQAIVSPSQGNQIVFLEAKVKQEGNSLWQTTRSKLRKWGNEWYPESIIFEQSVDGRASVREEAIFTNVKINEPIDSSIFTFAGIKMLPEVPVALPDPKQNGYIREGKIEPIVGSKSKANQISPPPPVPATDPAERQWNPWLLALSIALGLAAVVLIVLKVRAKRAAS